MKEKSNYEDNKVKNKNLLSQHDHVNINYMLCFVPFWFNGVLGSRFRKRIIRIRKHQTIRNPKSWREKPVRERETPVRITSSWPVLQVNTSKNTVLKFLLPVNYSQFFFGKTTNGIADMDPVGAELFFFIRNPDRHSDPKRWRNEKNSAITGYVLF